MTDKHKELCERLREEIALFKVARINPGQIVPALAMIEQQAARIQQQALEYVSLFDQCSEHLARIAELEADRDCWRDQCAQRVADWDEMRKERDEQHTLITRLKSMTDAQEALIREHIAAQRRAEAVQLFAGLVLKEHRNDGYPGDLDGDFLQSAAVQAGLLEERTVAQPCGENCACAEATMPAEFPVVCYFTTEAGRAAIGAVENGEEARGANQT